MIFRTFLNKKKYIEVVKGEGINLFSKKGKKYTDQTGGVTGHAILGWGNKKVINSINKHFECVKILNIGTNKRPVTPRQNTKFLSNFEIRSFLLSFCNTEGLSIFPFTLNERYIRGTTAQTNDGIKISTIILSLTYCLA